MLKFSHNGRLGGSLTSYKITDNNNNNSNNNNNNNNNNLFIDN